MINIVFCDDNTEFMNLLAIEVKRLFNGFVLQNNEFKYRCFADGNSLVSYGHKQKIDVAFLDIDMKVMDGFQIAQRLLELNEDVLIVFVSAYDQYVYDVFEFSPVAFIRKSCLNTELERVVKRVANIIDDTNSRMGINTTEEGKVSIKSKDIVYINSIGNYCYIRMANSKQYSVRDTLSNLENLLSNKGFYRVHSAYLINLHHIQRIERNVTVIMGQDQITVPISQRRSSGFRKAYADMVVRRLI